MATETIVIFFLVGFGLTAGYFIARTSERREAIASGGAAKLFNYLSSSLMVTIGPVVLASVLFLHLRLIELVLTVVVMFVLAVGLLFPYAAMEKPVLERRAQQADRGWTQRDAETSGL